MMYVAAYFFFEYPPSENILFVQGRRLLAMDPMKLIIIVNDPLIFTQSDIHVSNFGVDKYDNTVLLDFGQIRAIATIICKVHHGSG